MAIQLTNALLRLPDGRFVFNRRAEDDPQAGGRIGLFGGGVKPGEGSSDALRRELTEESTLTLGDLVLRHISHIDFPASESEGHGEGSADVYLIDIPSDNFDVREGGAVVTLGYEEAISHPDLASQLRALLPAFMKAIEDQA